jgi:hypothetical protein
MRRFREVVRELRDVRRMVQRDLTSRLLVAAMLAPVMSALLGWPTPTPLGVPLALHAAILTAVLLIEIVRMHCDVESRVALRLAEWAPVPLLSVAFAVLVRERSNVFYTGRALMDGMALLFAVHAGLSALRQRAQLRRDIRLVGANASDCASATGERGWSRTVCASTSPAVRLSDRLTTVVGWSVLVSWLLIGLAHRHVVGPLLMLAGVLEVIALVVLVPDVLAIMGWLPRDRIRSGSAVRPVPLFVVRGAPPVHSPFFIHPLRRR